MIQGVKKQVLNPETVLSKISEYDIFRRYMPDTLWKINHVTISPFLRSTGKYEENPSFMISNRGGSLSFIDFSDTSKRGNCFIFVMQLFMLPMDEALAKIDQDFGLGISSKGPNLGKYKEIVREYKQPEEIGKRYSFIQVITRKFNKEELDYWAQYQIGIEDLRENHIHAIDSVFLNRSKFMMSSTDLKFGYLYDNCWKIYRPYVNKKYKWMPNNVPITVMEGLDKIHDAEFALITKSKKDYMVLKKVIDNVCATQNEGIACFSEENVQLLRQKSKRQILSFDNDVPGVENSKLITKVFGFDYCNVPKDYIMEGITDWADLLKAHGYEPIKEILKRKGLL